MKNAFRVAALAAALALAGTASAQEASKGNRFGFGVGLPTSELAGLFAGGVSSGLVPQIYLPINVTPAFRIEPQFGILTLSEDGDLGSDASYVTLGAGAFYVASLGQQADLYVGPRLLLAFFREENPTGVGTEKISRDDWFLAAALGGEYMPHPRVAVGAEVQLGRWSIGDEKTEFPGAPTDEAPGGSSVTTQGVLFVRVYLF